VFLTGQEEIEAMAANIRSIAKVKLLLVLMVLFEIVKAEGFRYSLVLNILHYNWECLVTLNNKTKKKTTSI
jgi:hypothetical protein